MRQLHHLPALAALQSDLLLVFPPSADLTNQTIAQLLQQIPAGMYTGDQHSVGNEELIVILGCFVVDYGCVV